MPGVLSHPRKDAATGGRIWRYIAYGVGEVLLIFIGVTLAVAFENSNERRRIVALERDLLTTIESNLRANVREMSQNIALDESFAAAAETSLAQLRRGGEWPDSLNVTLGRAFFWTSPFLAGSGYESLQQLGLHVVSDPDLRDALVHLHERTYTFLTGDTDRAQWAFQESVLFPLIAEELEPEAEDLSASRSGFARSYRPRDGANTDSRLKSALAEHRRRVLDGIRIRRDAISETEEVARLIRDFLGPA